MKKKKAIMYILLAILGLIVCIEIIFKILHKMQDNIDEKEKAKTFEEISYTIPKEFERDEEYYGKYYNYVGDSIYCGVFIYSYEKYYDDFLEWFKNQIHINLNDSVSEIEEIELNNKKVYSVEIKNENEIEYHYGIESSNYYYSIEYYISDRLKGDRVDMDTNPCYVSKDKIISSIKIK